MGTDNWREKNDIRFAAIVELFPTDCKDVLKLGPAEPTRMRNTMVAGIHWNLIQH